VNSAGKIQFILPFCNNHRQLKQNIFQPADLDLWFNVPADNATKTQDYFDEWENFIQYWYHTKFSTVLNTTTPP
jgi:hypothetical protein